MKDIRFARLILQPSAGSMITICLTSLAVMTLAGFSFASKSGLVYNYFFGEDSSSALIESSKSTISVFSETVFGNPLLNKILFFVFWMIIGLVVYTILSGLSASATEAQQTAEESKYVHAGDNPKKQFTQRLVLRIIALGLIIIYLVVFTRILLPFGVLTARIVAGNLSNIQDWLFGVLGFLVLSGSLYIGLVLLRFLLLRPRVFGGLEDIIIDEIEHDQHIA